MIFHPVNNNFLELPILALLCLNVGQQSNSDGLEGGGNFTCNNKLQ